MMNAHLVVLTLIAASGGPAQPVSAQRADAKSAPVTPAAVAFRGQVVNALDDQIRAVLQASDGAMWFGSNGRGVFRWDEKGGTLVRFATEHGLAGDHIIGIGEDRAGNVLVVGEGGVSRFDGAGFVRVAALEPGKSEWKLGADDLWFPAGQDTGAVFRWDGTSLHRLTFPATAAGDAATLPRSQFPNAKYSPYDVYTITRDSRGRVWFGTAILGACRYDGESFVWVGHNENGSFGVRGIVEDREGRIWLSNTLRRFVEEPGGRAYRAEPGVGKDTDAFSHFVSAARDKDGHLWLAIMGGAVYRYDGTTWTRYLILHDGEPTWINLVYRDRENRLWVGSNEHGAYRLEGGEFVRARF